MQLNKHSKVLHALKAMFTRLEIWHEEEKISSDHFCVKDVICILYVRFNFSFLL